jgi:carbon-monoxide dehydrogenase medium subunit
LNAETIEAAAEAVAGAADPRTDHRGSAAYKRQVVKTFVTRILTNIAQSEPKAA